MSNAQKTGNPPSHIAPEFALWFKRRRLNLGLKQTEVAKRARLSTGTIARFEHEVNGFDIAVSVEVMTRIADALEVELGYLLHKAGMDIGASGINMTRLRRIEESVESFAKAETIVRKALANAIVLAERDGEENLLADLGRALAAHDIVTETLRDEGFITGDWRPATLQPGLRPWTAAEENFLRSHPKLSNEDAAEQLFRSAESVRAKRKILNAKLEDQ